MPYEGKLQNAIFITQTFFSIMVFPSYDGLTFIWWKLFVYSRGIRFCPRMATNFLENLFYNIGSWFPRRILGGIFSSTLPHNYHVKTIYQHLNKTELRYLSKISDQVVKIWGQISKEKKEPEKLSNCTLPDIYVHNRSKSFVQVFTLATDIYFTAKRSS
jgi:hypothetical protein